MRYENIEAYVADHVDDYNRPDGEEWGRGQCPFHEGDHKDRNFAFNVKTGGWVCHSHGCGEEDHRAVI